MNDSNSENEDADNVLIKLLEQGDLAAWLNETEIRRTCLAELKELGLRPPSNHILFHTLRHALGAGQKATGKALLSRLREQLDRWPKVQKFLARLLIVSKNSVKLAELKSSLLAELRGEAAKPPSPDEDTPLEILVALHNGRKIDGLSSEFSEISAELSQAISDQYNSIVAPSSHNPLQTNPETAAEFIRYDSGQYPFTGRSDEMALLRRFVGDGLLHRNRQAFQWVLITGAAGEGKSRLALELWQELWPDESLWQSLWLTKDAADAFHAHTAKWRPSRPTLMVIDYPARAPKSIGQMLANLADNSHDYDFPVRVLLLERDAEGEWFDRAFPEGGETTRLRQHRFPETNERGVWPLPPMQQKAVVDLMRRRFEAAGIKPPGDHSLFQKACEVDPRSIKIGEETISLPRPLFAAIIAEGTVRAHLEEGIDPAQALSQFNRSDVLDSLIKRDRDQYWRPAAGGADEDAREKLLAHENLLVLATITQGLDCDHLGSLGKTLDENLPKQVMGQRPRLDGGLLNRMSDCINRQLRPLEPDLLGEYFVLQWLESSSIRPAFAQQMRNAAFSIGGDDTAIFILRAMRDFPDRLRELQFLAPDQNCNRRGILTWAQLTVDLCNRLCFARDWSALGCLARNV